MSEPTSGASAPGGHLVALAKRGAEHLLWTRVAVQRRLEAHRPAARRLPPPVPPTDLLRSEQEWREAVATCRRLRLPLHHDRPKNWDALGAVATVLDRCGRAARVLDAGSARYSPVLPWLRLYGLGDLTGINLEFTGRTTHDGVVFDHGDITRTAYADGRFDAVTCMSVIEHGVDVEAFLAESARILSPGGVLVVSTDFDADPPDTSGIIMYGQPVRIFSPAALRDLVDVAATCGLRLLGGPEAVTDAALAHSERPVHWQRTGLDYTFVRLAFVRDGHGE